MKKIKPTKKLSGPARRRWFIKHGVCGACEHRPRWNDKGRLRPECKKCTLYYRRLAKAYRARLAQAAA
jgi:hypothetical protein